MIPKFRAFIIETEKLQEVWKMRFYETEELYINEYYGQDFILMQSTGLHDKNGVEIYEGDIVKPRFGKPFVVKHFIFGEGVFKTALITSGGHGFDGIYHGSLVEVIGNVHQHPELLEDV